MFNNIGRKIKCVAEIGCWMGIMISLILGIWLIVKSADWHPVFIVIGVGAILFGCLGAWIGSFCLYGFGELIDKTTEIASNTSSLKTINKSTTKVTTKAISKTVNDEPSIEEFIPFVK